MPKFTVGLLGQNRVVASKSILFRTTLTPLYISQFLIMSSSSVSNPILSLFAVSLGASVATAGITALLQFITAAGMATLVVNSGMRAS